MRKRQHDNAHKHKETTSHPKDKNSDSKKDVPTPKYGFLPRFNGQRLWSRGIIFIGVLIYVWYYSKGGKETTLAKQNQMYDGRGQNVECSKDFLEEISKYKPCVPKKCGRFVSDKIITSHEADVMMWLAKRGMAFGGGSGGATILDLHSGALSLDDKFVDVYQTGGSSFLTNSDIAIYKIIRSKIQNAVGISFGIDADYIYLTHPTFFSKLTSTDPKTIHDEYWHPHIDKYTYESFHYTTLLYLNDFNVDFKGGRFIYMNDIENPTKNVTVEPRKGRVSMFTSGSENPHFVERVADGERFAITISFTCDKSKAIDDPFMKT